VRLIDVPDLGYTTKDQPNPRGEICVMTDDIIKGYYKDEKATYVGHI
jgi:long-chain acyl-CoA synthetase